MVSFKKDQSLIHFVHFVFFRIEVIDMFNGVIIEGPSNGTNPDNLEFLAKEKANLIL
jgi:hypothetical protein